MSNGSAFQSFGATQAKERLDLDLAGFALQEQAEDNLDDISLAWYNGSYTMAGKPIKSLELHYAII